MRSTRQERNADAIDESGALLRYKRGTCPANSINLAGWFVKRMPICASGEWSILAASRAPAKITVWPFRWRTFRTNFEISGSSTTSSVQCIESLCDVLSEPAKQYLILRLSFNLLLTGVPVGTIPHNREGLVCDVGILTPSGGLKRNKPPTTVAAGLRSPNPATHTSGRRPAVTIAPGAPGCGTHR